MEDLLNELLYTKVKNDVEGVYLLTWKEVHYLLFVNENKL